MRPRLVVCVFFCLVTILWTATLHAALAGSWSGAYTAISTGCNPDVRHGGGVSASFTENGTNASGQVTLQIILEDCRTTAPQTFTASFQGTASGDTVSGTLELEGFGVPVHGTLSADSLTFSFTAGDTTVIARLSRAGTSPANFSGSWSGHLAATATFCDPPVPISAPTTLTLTQQGNSVSGTVAFEYSTRDCVPGTPSTITIPIEGTVTGQTFQAAFDAGPELPPGQVHGTLVGGTIELSIVAGDTTGVATLGSTAHPTDVAGTWTGTHQTTTHCRNGETHSESGSFVLELTQTGTSVTGAATIVVPFLDEQCDLDEKVTLAFPLAGTASGGMFAAAITIPFAESDEDPILALNAFVSGAMMNGTLAGEQSNGTVTLTRGSAEQPDSHLSGTYVGTFDATMHEEGCPSLSFTSPVELTLRQSGSALTGTMVIRDSRHYDKEPDGSCRLHEVPEDRLPVSGMLDGNSVAGFVFSKTDATHSEGSTEMIPFAGSFVGDTLTATASEPTFHVMITASRGVSPTPPVITTFTADPQTINPGGSSVLRWATSHATSVSIDNGIGAQPASGSVTVSPAATTTYTLTATGPGGTASAITTVTVTSAPPADVIITSVPAGMVQYANQSGATDALTLFNAGGSATTVTLTANGGFFTIAPAVVALPPGASALIGITSTATQPGLYDGTIQLSGAGIPQQFATVAVRLFISSAAPVGTVEPAGAVGRVEVSGPQEQNPSGSVPFTNGGTATVEGIATSDAPWLVVLDDGVITIPPGETRNVSFRAERSRRAAGATTAVGKISLLFLRPDANAPAIGAAGTQLLIPTTTSVTVVDVVKPPVAGGSAPALQPGQIALFVPGLGNRTGAAGDLVLSNALGSALGNLDLYFSAPGASGLTGSLPQIPAYASLFFPDLLKTVFATSASSGTVQIRPAQVLQIAVSGLQSNASSSAGVFATALPVFRSDRGAAAGAEIVLSGVTRGGGLRTDLVVQEVSGNSATVRIEFARANGSIVSSRTETLPRFGMLELLDAVPAEARAVRIVNQGPSPSRIAAFATVASESSGDGWTSVDPTTLSASSEDILFAPLFSAGTNARTELHLTNRTNVPVAVTVDVRSGSTPRRRAVRTQSAEPNAVTTTTIAAEETVTIDTGSFRSGAIRISAPGAAVSAAARSVTSNGSLTFGTGLPVVPASYALGAGNVRRFAGVDDGSDESQRNAVPATFRTSLLLVETSGQNAIANVTLRYSFPTGGGVSGIVTATKSYNLGAASIRLIDDLASDVIGSARSSFGDLRNMQVEVSVAGEGRVLPVIRMIENRSGDTIVRID